MSVHPVPGDVVIVDFDNHLDDMLNAIGVSSNDLFLPDSEFNIKHSDTKFPKPRYDYTKKCRSPHGAFLRHMKNTVYAFWYMRPSTKYHGKARFMGVPLVTPYKGSKAIVEDLIRMRISLNREKMCFKEWFLIDDYRKGEGKNLFKTYQSISTNQKGCYGYDVNTDTFAVFLRENATSRYVVQMFPSPQAIENSIVVDFFCDYPHSRKKRYPGFIVKCPIERVSYEMDSRNMKFLKGLETKSYESEGYQFFFVPCNSSMILESEWLICFE